MAVGDYRFRLPGGKFPKVNMNGMVKFEVFVEVQIEEGPEVWQQVEGGHFDVLISGAALVQASTAIQVLNHIEGVIKDRGIAQSDRARRALYALLPGGAWPEDDIVRYMDIE